MVRITISPASFWLFCDTSLRRQRTTAKVVAFQAIPGVDINVFGLVFVSLGAGILSGFTGVGGAFIVMPALIILGFPASFAVGTSLTWVMGNSIIGAFRHGKLGNVDVKLGLVMIAASIGGVEVGVRIINWTKNIGLAEEFVLSISVCLLLVVGTYMLWECVKRKRQLDRMLEKNEKIPPDIRAMSLSQKLQTINMPPLLNFAKSSVTISLWVILTTSFVIGMVVGILGVGGGFIVVPVLVYLFGVSSLMAVGTSLFQIVFSSAYGAARHAMSGNVIILASLIMIVASSISVQFGAQVTRHVSGLSIRFVLGLSTLASAIAAIFKLFSVLQNHEQTWLDTGSMISIFSGMILSVTMIFMFYVLAVRYRNGQHIPMWTKAFVTHKDSSL